MNFVWQAETKQGIKRALCRVAPSSSIQYSTVVIERQRQIYNRKSDFKELNIASMTVGYRNLYLKLLL